MSRVMLYTKGAESSVLPRCVEGAVRETAKHIDEYALVGLRTLAVAVRELDGDTYEQFVGDINEASQSLEEREKKISEVYNRIEKDLVLLGASAVEDKLQEGVSETLVSLGLAGVSVWI